MMDSPKSCTSVFLLEFCRRQGFLLNDEGAEKLSAYLNLLMRWNSVINLVGAKNWREALETLIIDSFYLAQFFRKEIRPKLPCSFEIWDLGAGAGLPGIPLRILWQDGEYWMVERREKRALFLSTVLTRLPLPGTYVFRGRAEVFMRNRKANLVVSRAFMPWKKLLGFVRGHLQNDGVVVFLSLEELHTETTLPWKEVGLCSYEVLGEKRYCYAFSESMTGIESSL